LSDLGIAVFDYRFLPSSFFAAAVAVASLLKERTRFAGKKVAIVICGGNVGRKTLMKILAA